MKTSESGPFLWAGSIPGWGIGNDGRLHRVREGAQDFVAALSQVTDVRHGPLAEWRIENESVWLRGERIAPTDLARTRTLLIDIKKEDPEGRKVGLALERFFAERYPNVAILNPIAAEPLFASKLAFLKMASGHPGVGDLVVPHQEIRTRRDVDTAIERFSFPIVVKADDLAHGHGMGLVRSCREFLAHVRTIRMHPIRYRVERVLQPWRETARRWMGRPSVREHHYLNNGRVLATPFVETHREALGGRLVVALNYLGPQLVRIRPKVMSEGWVSHLSAPRPLTDLGEKRVRTLAVIVMDAVEQARGRLTTLRSALPAWPVRFDTLIDRDGRLVVSEPEFKWGNERVSFSFFDTLVGIGYDPNDILRRTGWNVHIDVGVLARARSHMG